MHRLARGWGQRSYERAKVHDRKRPACHGRELKAGLMKQAAPRSSDASPIDAGLRALCGIAAYYRIGADPDRASAAACAGRSGGRRTRSHSRRPADRVAGAAGCGRGCAADGEIAHSGDCPAEGRRVFRLRRAGPVGALPAGRSDQPCGDGDPARGACARQRRAGASDRPPGRRRRRRPEDLRDALVPADPVALPQTARACAGGVAVRPDLRPDDAADFPGDRRQGADAQGLRDPVRDDRRPGGHRPVRRHAAVSAHLRAVAHHQPHRRRTRSAAVRPSPAAADRLFRDAPGRTDGRPGAGAGDHPRLPDRSGAVFGDRLRLHLRLHRGDVRLFDQPHPDRADRPAGLRADRLPGQAAAARSGQREVQPGRGEPAVPGRDHRRGGHGQGGGGRADDARAVGGKARRLREDELRHDHAGLGRATGHPVRQQAHHRRRAAVRRQGGDRRPAQRRGAGRLQHDRLAGGAADPQAVADLAGFPAGADLDRPAGRHPQHGPGARAADAACAADAARRHRTAQCRLPLSAGRSGDSQECLACHPAGRDHRRWSARPARASRR